MEIAWAWMAEKSFAATPYLCHDEILDLHILTKSSVENFVMASNKIMSKLKDFEDIHALANKHCIPEIAGCYNVEEPVVRLSSAG